MDPSQILWLALALAAVLVVLLLMALTLRKPRKNTYPYTRSAWFVAAMISGMTLVSIALKVSDRIPNVTFVDVGAVVITGILTLVFLTLGLLPSPQNRVG